MRIWKLGHIPGVNGDEAWVGVQAMAAIRHEPTFCWQTPTGNPLNVFFFIPTLLLHLVAEPSFGLLRTPAAVSGILALPAAFFMCRRAFDQRTAWIFALLLAVLPINIAYSRFAWDSCQSLLATLCAMFPVFYAIREAERRIRWLLWSGVGFAAALLVHPTNIFVAPVLIIAAAFGWRSELRSGWSRLTSRRKKSVFTIALVCLANAIVIFMLWTPAANGTAERMKTIRENLTSATNAATFAKCFSRLFSGITTFQYVAGSCADQNSLSILANSRAESYRNAYAPLPDPVGQRIHDLPMIGLFVVAMIGFFQRLRSEHSAADAALLIGWTLMVSGFYLVAGVIAISPHFERYATCLIAATALLLARGAEWLSRGSLRLARATTIGLLAVAWLWLGSFYANYFAFIERTGDESHMAFRTSSIEPKEAVIRHIRWQHQGDQAAWIICREWWSAYPLKYLASSDPNLKVPLDYVGTAFLPECGQDSQLKELAAAFRERRVWCVEFIESSHYPELKNWLAQQTGSPIEEKIVVDFASRPLLSIMHAASQRTAAERVATD